MVRPDWELVCLRDCPAWKERAVVWFHDKWRIPEEAYRQSIQACLACPSGIPQWYLVVRGDGEIIAGLGVIENDFHRRPDLRPNVCAVYVEPAYRGRGIARAMLDFVCGDLAALGETDAYLLTDHTAFYERCGWSFLCMVEEDGGGQARMYHRALPHG